MCKLNCHIVYVFLSCSNQGKGLLSAETDSVASGETRNALLYFNYFC